MKNLNVRYNNVPRNIQEDMRDEFCMGWESSNGKNAIKVDFLGFTQFNGLTDGFRLKVGEKIVSFDYFSTSYFIEQ
ncbi:hypothetical protein F4V43_02395 [Paenibacillus spiritus]|uniref:Uncharacterized protein n=1 Tax=Paenibacillus spiritus TaxID=2496557 RepID=A0A5J5GGL9_9BACL|nr:hypothetical protein [Paenibacillus spiritus]KAA9007356.1 hypothetical protein F4V43_02395 [Paenibacillus spiritus]